MAEKHALLIAVDHYQGSPLQFCVADAQALSSSLRQFGFTSREVLPNGSTDQVVARLKEYVGRVRPGDTFLFYFAGHGVHAGSHSYLLCADATLEAPRGLTLASVTELMDQMLASQKILICDACRESASGARGTGQPGMAEQMFGEFDKIADRRLVASHASAASEADKSVNWYALLSCSQGERSWEAAEFQHGVFSYHLFAALDNLGSGTRGRDISINEVATRVAAEVSRWSSKNPGRAMRPYSVGSGAVTLRVGEDRGSESVREGVNWILIPAGDFVLEGRRHRIEEFQTASHPVTVATYAAHAKLPQNPPPNNLNWAWRNRAITCISWRNATEWCKNRGASLPAEAQLEYVRALNLRGVVFGPVLEWCWDGVGSADSARRVIRGTNIRTTRGLEDTDDNLGFRCVRK